MLRRIPRFLRVSVLAAVVLAVTVSVVQSWSTGAPGTGGWVQTQWGPLGPADRDLLVKVRLAGLWEGPTGQQAAQQAVNPAVKEVGRVISTEHATLDAEVRKVADQLGVLLPTSASAQQTAWMQEISAASGSDYDRVFIQRLREAHGIVLPIISEVRVSTRNELIRQFADTADKFVRGHIQHLEDSGLVDYAKLPDPPTPGLLAGDRSMADLIVPILVFVAALLAAVGMALSLRRRRGELPGRENRRTRQPAIVEVEPNPTPTPARAVAAIPAQRRPREGSVEETGPIPVITSSPAPSTATRSRHVQSGAGAVEATGPRHAVRR
ncbi:DUF4142 domain-containing protein [Pseudonocardia sp. GCM10023141]|uniref:DUF4142 domain-containing protein n=1 Tax=Pseudonocardia sp. GCM10023141 TaxID=3252653 RepID=UPI0036102AD7